MKIEKRSLYVCEYCGETYTHASMCREHEKDCSKKVEKVQIVLVFDKDKGFTFKTFRGRMWADPDEDNEEMFGYDDDCDCFVMQSTNTSEERVKELKDKLIKKAVEHIKSVRDNSGDRAEKLIDALKNFQEAAKDKTE